MKIFLRILLATAALLGSAASINGANAAVTFSLSAGASCGGASSATYTPGGAATLVSLCATATADPMCGVTAKFLSGVVAQNEFEITAREFASGAFPDVATVDGTLFNVGAPLLNDINNPSTNPDLGGLVAGVTSTAAAGTFRVATYTISSRVTATNNLYTFSTVPLSYSIPDAAAANDCSTPTDGATVVAATFTLNKLLPPTAVTFTATPSPLTFNEGGVAQNLIIACTGTFGTPASVTVTPTSTNPTAFTVPAGALTFSSCAPQTITVTPRAADAAPNPAQTGNVTFVVSSGGTAPAAVLVTVNDLQVPATYTMTKTTATVTEGNGGTDTITVTCNGAFTAAAPGTVAYSITGLIAGATNDYTASPASPLSFATCGGATQSVTISPRTNDTAIQGNRSGTITLSNPTAGTLSGASTGTINVNDNDSAQAIAISVAGSPASEAGGVLTYTLTRTGGSAEQLAATLTVNLTSPSGSRFDPAPASKCGATITFAANFTTATCTVTGLNNLVIDGNTSASVVVAPPSVLGIYSGTGNTATGTITDDDLSVTVTPTSATEGGAVTFSIACTGPAGVSVTGLSFAVTPAQDVGATPATPGMSGAIGTLGTLTCGTPFLVTVPTFNDVIIGNGRTLSLALSGTPVASNNGTVVLPAAAAVASVLDNDQPLIVQPVIVPTMSAVGLGMLAMLIFGFAAFGQRRRVK